MYFFPMFCSDQIRSQDFNGAIAVLTAASSHASNTLTLLNVLSSALNSVQSENNVIQHKVHILQHKKRERKLNKW